MSRKNPLINASSMADIAFLLLVFFLVTTTIDSDKGLTVKLPIISTEEIIAPINNKNVLQILVNSKNEILLNDKKIALNELKKSTLEHVTEKAESPIKSVVSLKNDVGTDYKTYVAVHNELKAAYKHLWNNEARKLFNKKYESLKIEDKKAVRKKFPYKISEAEPEEN